MYFKGAIRIQDCINSTRRYDVMAKVVLPKSGPADHFWSPKLVWPDHLWTLKLVSPDHICPLKMVLPCHKRSAIQIVVNYTLKVCPSFFFLQLEDNVFGLLFTIL